MPRVLGGSQGGGRFVMGEVPLQAYPWPKGLVLIAEDHPGDDSCSYSSILHEATGVARHRSTAVGRTGVPRSYESAHPLGNRRALNKVLL